MFSEPPSPLSEKQWRDFDALSRKMDRAAGREGHTSTGDLARDERARWRAYHRILDATDPTQWV